MNLTLFKYKYRFLIGYIFIGVISIIFELTINKVLSYTVPIEILHSIFSFSLGVLLAFWLNIRYNFKISKSKRNKALKYFIIISLLSYAFQKLVLSQVDLNYSYELSRIVVSGFFFWIAYFFHLRYSFKDYKKVGVAIYANGLEDIDKLYNRVKDYPDFIHVDIVDNTFNKNTGKVLSYKTEVIKGYWNKKFIEAHIMSKTPSKWINQIINSVDRIYIHVDLDEDLYKTLLLIKKSNKEAGIVIHKRQDLKKLNSFSDIIDSILVLTIDHPGFSGQKFSEDSFGLIEEINRSTIRKKISLNVDGGINQDNISKINSENVVSGSYVLGSDKPINNIMILQTSSQYERFYQN